MGKPAQQLTKLLKDSSQGDSEALKVVWTEVYDELGRLARRAMAKENSGHTLQPTALVHEAFLKIFDGKPVDFQNRGHFFAIAAQAMRQITVDHAKAKRAQKRGGGDFKITFDDNLHGEAGRGQELDVLVLDQALDRLGKMDPRLVKVVELRYFGGLSLEETAEALNVSLATVKRDWASAKLWLYRELSGEKDAK